MNFQKAPKHVPNLIVVGGVPAPIGGVTTYLRRLLFRDFDKIDLLVDFYKGEKEKLPPQFEKKVAQVGSRAGLVKWFWKNNTESKTVFFNFSTPKALVLLLLIPKHHRCNWRLMLHHGNLVANGFLARMITRLTLSRFDEVCYLSVGQKVFFEDLGMTDAKLKSSSSYCEPRDHVDLPEAELELKRISSRYRKIVVMSGFPKQIYNFKLGIEALAACRDKDVALCLFIYGPGDLREELKALASHHDWIQLFDGKSERYFNTFLNRSDLLLRLTSTESFGISVWDAAYWGRKIIATDVCKRPQEASVVHLSKENVIGELKMMDI